MTISDVPLLDELDGVIAQAALLSRSTPGAPVGSNTVGVQAPAYALRMAAKVGSFYRLEAVKAGDQASRVKLYYQAVARGL